MAGRAGAAGISGLGHGPCTCREYKLPVAPGFRRHWACVSRFPLHARTCLRRNMLRRNDGRCGSGRPGPSVPGREVPAEAGGDDPLVAACGYMAVTMFLGCRDTPWRRCGAGCPPGATMPRADGRRWRAEQLDSLSDIRKVPTLSWEQVPMLLDKVGDLQYRTLFLPDIPTGLRRSELLGLQWRDIYLN